MSSKSYRVIAKMDGRWNVKRDGASRATKSFATQKDAIKYGRTISRSHDAELIVHDRNGRIRSMDSYGHDPKPRKLS